MVFLYLILAGCFACSNQKKEQNEEKYYTALPLSGVSEEGRSLNAACKSCHGDCGQGNSRLNAPALANVDSWYVYGQDVSFQKPIIHTIEARRIHCFITLASITAGHLEMALLLKDDQSINDVIAYIGSVTQVVQ